MVARVYLLTAALVGVAIAQTPIIIPGDMVGHTCDGLSRPDWPECHDKILDDIIGQDIVVGPDIFQGQVFTYENCQVRYFQCTASGLEFTVDYAHSLFVLLARECENLGAGGVRRQGDLCMAVEDPNNPFTPETEALAMERRGEFLDQPAWPVNSSEGSPPSAPVISERQRPKDVHLRAARNLVEESAALKRRQQYTCDGGGEPCYIYEERGFADNIRGEMTYVCDDILPDGGSCTEGRTVTVTEGFTGGIEASAGLFDVINIGASFSTSYENSVETSLSTTVTVSCPGGSGYIVWYPLMQISSGECIQGTCNNIGDCQNRETHSCTIERPIMPDEGTLSGEYDFICI